MVLPKAYFAIDTHLQIGDGATPTEGFDTIPGVGSITGPGQTRDTIDVTSHSSSGGYREYIGGLRDGGELSFDLFWLWTDDTQNALEDAYNSDDTVNFRVVYDFTPNDEYDQFAGLVTDLSKASPVDGAATRSCTIKITGPVSRDTIT